MNKMTKQKSNNKMIGMFFCSKEQLKKEFLIKNIDKEIPLIVVCIYENKNYGAVAKIGKGQDMIKKMFKNMGKTFKQIDEDKKKGIDKPIDTSNWVKPDEESIRNELIKELFAIIILKEDSVNYPSHYAKMEVLYSILHSHSPRNPQGLTNYYIIYPEETILREFKNSKANKSWEILFGKDGKKKFNKKSHKEVREWIKHLHRKMIIKIK